MPRSSSYISRPKAPISGLEPLLTPSHRFTFNGKEKDDEFKGVGNSLSFQARFYDCRLGKWLSTDPAFNQYPSLSSYAYTANNPIWFYEVDGRVFDLSNMSKSDRASYDATIKRLSSSKLFRYYYKQLEKSPQTYTVNVDPNLKTGGQYSGDTKSVSFKEMNSYVVAQELFHAFQDDLGVYDSEIDHSNIEAEGDIMTKYVMIEAVLPIQNFEPGSSWDTEINANFGGEFDIPSNSEVQSEAYNNFFQKAVEKRIIYYKDIEKKYDKSGSGFYDSYTKFPKSDANPEAIRRVFNETSNDKIGPTNENGDY
jgi:RHS repeat-associated protein